LGGLGIGLHIGGGNVINRKNEWLISAVVLVLAGCGGGGGDDESAAATAPAQQQPAQSAPTISGSPTTSVTAGQTYTFQPSAADANGDTLSFSITGAPSWASFNASTGRLSGSPGANDVGTDSNIVISVSDGGRSASLPAFSIEVNPAAPTGGTNSAPTISGNPTTSLNAGMAYSFQPTAADADDDTLTFSVVNAPSWASFNPQTGRLSGTPGAGNVGTTSNIRISVSDGTVSTQLAAFSITVSQISNGSVTLDWTPPTSNADGSTLANLSGYRILYGTSPGALNQTVDISNPSVTSYVVQNLSAATWYFSLRSVNSQGVESVSTNPVSQVIL
jgi:hypothetical protein